MFLKLLPIFPCDGVYYKRILGRFESRSERLARIEAEKEAKRKERQEKAALARSSSDGVDPVEAALARVKAKQESAVGEQTEP